MFFSFNQFLFVRLAFCGIDRGNQQLLDLNAFFKYRFVIIVTALGQKFEPIFAFGTLLEGDLKFGDKIGSTVTEKRFPDIRADTRSGADQLICQNTLLFVLLHLVAYFDDLQRKFLGFRDQRAVCHKLISIPILT